MAVNVHKAPSISLRSGSRRLRAASHRKQASPRGGQAACVCFGAVWVSATGYRESVVMRGAQSSGFDSVDLKECLCMLGTEVLAGGMRLVLLVGFGGGN